MRLLTLVHLSVLAGNCLALRQNAEVLASVNSESADVGTDALTSKRSLLTPRAAGDGEDELVMGSLLEEGKKWGKWGGHKKFGKWGGHARPDQCGICQENLRAAVTYCDFYWAGWYVQDGAFTYQMSYQVAEYDVPEAECDEFAAFDKELEQKGSTLGGHDAAVKDMKEESAVDTAMKETGIDGDKTEGKEDDGDMGEKGSDDWGDWGDKEGDYGDKGTTTEKDVAETVMQIGDADDKSEAVDELVKGIKAIQKARTDSAKSWETLDNINAPPTPAPVPSRMGRNGADATPTMAPTQYPSTTQDVLCAGNVCSPSCDNKPLCVSNGCVLVDHALNGAPPHMLCTLPGASR